MANSVAYIQSPFNKTRKDKFTMVLNLPLALKQKATRFNRTENTIIPETLQFSVFGAVVPEISIPPVQTRYAGQTLTQSSHSRDPYQPLTVNFTVDNRFNNYWVLYTWLDLLNNDQTGIYDAEGLTLPTKTMVQTHVKSDFNQYKATISIFGLDEYNKRVIEFKYTDAFPTNLGGIGYSHRDNSELESSFTLSYSQLLVKPIDTEIQ